VPRCTAANRLPAHVDLGVDIDSLLNCQFMRIHENADWEEFELSGFETDPALGNARRDYGLAKPVPWRSRGWALSTPSALAAKW